MVTDLLMKIYCCHNLHRPSPQSHCCTSQTLAAFSARPNGDPENKCSTLPVSNGSCNSLVFLGGRGSALGSLLYVTLSAVISFPPVSVFQSKWVTPPLLSLEINTINDDEWCVFIHLNRSPLLEIWMSVCFSFICASCFAAARLMRWLWYIGWQQLRWLTEVCRRI